MKREDFVRKNNDLARRRDFAALMSLPLLFLVSLIVSLPFSIIKIGITGSILLTALSEIIVILWALWYTGQLTDWRDPLGLHKAKVRWFIFAALAGFGLFVLLQLLSTLFQKMGMKIESSNTSVAIESLQGVQRSIVLFVVTPFLIPLLEEIFFRGYVFGFLKNGLWGKSKTRKLIISVFVSSLFFAFCHSQATGPNGSTTFNDVFIVVYIFVIAVVSALFVNKMHSIFVSWTLHLTYNLMTVMLFLIV